jgi:D-alanine-D-alanine ligase
MTSELFPRGRIAVLLGGDSSERDISLQSGQAIAAAARSLGLDALEVDPAEANWITSLREVDIVFIALHGPGGEDGGVQGALQTLGIPYTGSGVLGSALAMDKRRSKELWQGIGLPTAGFATLNRDCNWQDVIDRFGRVFVKPACEGSSIGMSIADSASGLEQAFSVASAYAGEVLAEQYIDGPEYTVGVLGDQALPSIRLAAVNEFYDYEAKYLSDETRYYCPSGLSEHDEAEIATLSLQAFRSLGCSVWGRVDVMRDSQGSFDVLEVNTVPGMTLHHSLVPMAAAAAGLDMSALVQRILQLSLQEKR